jgi:putative LysE/RhtB family amino acid efflux pump
MIVFLTGILVGLAVAAPIGPVALLCMRKTLEFGIALGSALADVTYASIAAFGLATFSEFLIAKAVYFKLFGGILLISLALKEYFSKNKMVKQVNVTATGSLSLTLTAFFLVLSNPMGIVSFIAIFAMLGDQLLTTHDAIWMVLGVFIGSFSWFFFLGKMIRRAEHLLPENFMVASRKISAVILAIFGLFALLSLFL